MAFPVGKERALVGELRTDSSLTVRLVGDDAQDIESIRLRVWGKDSKSFTRNFTPHGEFVIQLTSDESELAKSIDAYMYDLTAVMKEEHERIIAKGKVTVA